MIAIYAVKLNLDCDYPQDVSTFDKDKADKLRSVYWDMNSIRLKTEVVTNFIPTQEVEADGNIAEITEAAAIVYLTVVSDSVDSFEVACDYGFTEQQNIMLSDLLDENNDDLWAGLLGSS